MYFFRKSLSSLEDGFFYCPEEESMAVSNEQEGGEERVRSSQDHKMTLREKVAMLWFASAR